MIFEGDGSFVYVVKETCLCGKTDLFMRKKRPINTGNRDLIVQKKRPTNNGIRDLIMRKKRPINTDNRDLLMPAKKRPIYAEKETY